MNAEVELATTSRVLGDAVHNPGIRGGAETLDGSLQSLSSVFLRAWKLWAVSECRPRSPDESSPLTVILPSLRRIPNLVMRNTLDRLSPSASTEPINFSLAPSAP